VITLSAIDLGMTSLLMIAAAGFTHLLRLGLVRSMSVAAIRSVIQLLLIGSILEILFRHVHLGWLAVLTTIMLMVAGHEAQARQQRSLRGWWGFGIGTGAMFLSSFMVTIAALTVILGASPWYAPQYAIPLLGMLLGNTMNGVAISLDRLTQTAWEQREVIEARLLVGQSWQEAICELRQHSIRSGLIPIINAMASAGIVSLPGMMTGQILAGAPPDEAVKYQIMILFLITAGTTFGTVAAVWSGARRLFDQRERLRLDRLTNA
jgi:putative ABC transport system permease protein